MFRRLGSSKAPVLAILTLLSATFASQGCGAEAQLAGTLQEAASERDVREASCQGHGARAECFWVTVPEDRSRLQGRQIDLYVVVVRARASSGSEPVLFFPGGPGQATTDLIPFSQGLFGEVFETRDAVYVGQRGTGRSHPLHCEDGGGQAASGSFGQLFDVELVKDCYRTLQGRADPNHYRVEHYVADIEDVLDRLGYDRVLLWGGSGGTRTAQVFLREHPERVVATALVGVAPLDYAMPLPFAGFVKRSWQRVVADCAAQPTCDQAYPSLDASMTKIRRRLEQAPVPTEVVEVRGKVVTVDMNVGDFAYAVRGMLYSSQGVARLPRLVAAAAGSGDLSAFAQAHYQRSLGLRGGSGLSLGVHLSTYCSEDIPHIEVGAVASTVEGTLIGRYLVDQYSAACGAWPVTPAPKKALEPVRSDSPVLLVSGYYDPSTPETAAERVRTNLSQSRHIVVRDASHDAGFGCAASAQVRFLRDGSLENYRNSCVDRPIRFEVDGA